MVLARVDILSDPAQRVLQIAAVAGQRVDYGVLASVSGRPVADLVEVLREAVAHHVQSVEPGTDSYAFRHALVQEAIYDDLLPAERAPLHAAYAQAVAGRIEARRCRPAQLAGTPTRQARARALELLDGLGMADRRNAYPAQLSGGERQRVGVGPRTHQPADGTAGRRADRCARQPRR